MSRELTSLSLIAIYLSLAAAQLNFNFFLGGFVDPGLLHFGVPSGLRFGVEVIPGITSFLCRLCGYLGMCLEVLDMK